MKQVDIYLTGHLGKLRTMLSTVPASQVPESYRHKIFTVLYNIMYQNILTLVESKLYRKIYYANNQTF